MSEELLNIAKELSEKPTTELALQFMELTADNIIKDKEIDRLNNIIKELSKDVDMWNRKYNEQFDIINGLEKWIKENNLGKYRTENVVDTDELLDKLKTLKENNK